MIFAGLVNPLQIGFWNERLWSNAACTLWRRELPICLQVSLACQSPIHRLYALCTKNTHTTKILTLTNIFDAWLLHQSTPSRIDSNAHVNPTSHLIFDSRFIFTPLRVLCTYYIGMLKYCLFSGNARLSIGLPECLEPDTFVRTCDLSESKTIFILHFIARTIENVLQVYLSWLDRLLQVHCIVRLQSVANAFLQSELFPVNVFAHLWRKRRIFSPEVCKQCCL